MVEPQRASGGGHGWLELLRTGSRPGLWEEPGLGGYNLGLSRLVMKPEDLPVLAPCKNLTDTPATSPLPRLRPPLCCGDSCALGCPSCLPGAMPYLTLAVLGLPVVGPPRRGGRGTQAGPVRLSASGICLSCRDSSGAGGRDPGGRAPGFLGRGSSELSRLAFSRVRAFASCSGGCLIAWTEPPFLFQCSP